MGDQQAPIGEVFYIEGASSYKYGSVPLMPFSLTASD